MGRTGWRFLLAMIGMGVVLFARLPASAGPAASLPGFIDELARQHDDVKRLLGTGEQGPAMQRELERLTNEARKYGRLIVTSGPTTLELDASWIYDSLKDALEARNSAARRAALIFLERRMRRAVDAMREMGSLSPADPGARAALQRILNRSEFKNLDEKESWLSRLRDRLAELLRSLTEKSGGALKYVFNVPVAIAVVLLSVAYVAWRLALRPRTSSVAAGPPERRVLLALGHDKLAEQAGEAADSGDFRKAIRLLYLALLVRLDRTGRLHYLPWRTNWEYLDALRASSPSLADVFGPFTYFFERKWYGMEPCGPSDYDEGRRLYKNVLAEEGL